MTDETRTRFLAAIARQIPADRVIEVHLFSSMKQGGLESGVAVIAVDRIADIPGSMDVDGGYVPAAAVAEPSALDTPVELDVHDQLADEAAYMTDEFPVVLADALAEPASGALPSTPMVPSRYIVYSARYRLVLKGAERGKWDVSVTEEADAPLLTIDAVVRGVQRRSGDADEVLRLSGDEFRSALPA